MLLAGGGSTRFGGTPKGLAKIGGRRMLDLVAEALESATGAPPVLVSSLPDAAEWRPDLKLVEDLEPGTGSLGGLYTALVTLRSPILCLAWDLPLVTAALLRSIAAALPGRDAVVPQTGQRLQPLCAAYAPTCVDPIAKRLATGDLRMVGFLDEVRVHRLPASEVGKYGDPEDLFWNVNTREDLREAVSKWQDHESYRL